MSAKPSLLDKWTPVGPEAAAARGRFAMPVPSREEVRADILYMMGSVFVFSLINALVKWEAARYPLAEVVFFRCAFSLVPCVALLAASGGLALLRTHRLHEHIGRGVMQFIAMM